MEYITLNNGCKDARRGHRLLLTDEAESAVVSALHSGATLIDTANAYVNEKAVSRAMKAFGLQRGRYSSKVQAVAQKSFSQGRGRGRQNAGPSGHGLYRLAAHPTSPQITLPGTARWKKAYKEGKARAIGLSNFNIKQMEKNLLRLRFCPQVLQTSEFTPTIKSRSSKHF